MSNEQQFYTQGLMDLSNYRLSEVEDDKEWDDFVDASPQGTLFNTTTFLNALDRKATLLGCYKGDELKGGISVFEDNSDCISRPDLVIYNSFMLKKDDNQQAKGNQFAERFRIISSLVQNLTSRYKSIEFQTHSSFEDLRPLLWHNYGTDKAKFLCNPRFTSVLSFSESDKNAKDFLQSDLYAASGKSRRQEIRYALKKGVTIEKKVDLELLSKLYIDTFARQSLDVDGNELNNILNVCKCLHSKGLLSMYIAKNSQQEIGSIAVFGVDVKRAYYLYGANSHITREDNTGSLILFNAFFDLIKKGVQEVDLEGVNSPSRGHFKMSFGGQLKTYYSVTLNDKVSLKSE